MYKTSKANLTPKRQRTQYSCMSTSMSMCLQALDYPHATEDEVNKVMGALPMQGASWEQALACAQHYGCRATLTTPSTIRQLKEWTDKGIPVMIAWNPEGREWSHASVVFDVDEEMNVYVADPNIPDPDETVRIVPKAEFYSKWYEKWPNYLVRRPACAIEREITPDGRQIMASRKLTAKNLLKEVRSLLRTASDWEGYPPFASREFQKALHKELQRSNRSRILGLGSPSNSRYNGRKAMLVRATLLDPNAYYGSVRWPDQYDNDAWKEHKAKTLSEIKKSGALDDFEYAISTSDIDSHDSLEAFIYIFGRK